MAAMSATTARALGPETGCMDQPPLKQTDYPRLQGSRRLARLSVVAVLATASYAGASIAACTC